MQLPSIHIQTTHGQIGMQTNRPHLQIKQPQAELTIKQNHVDTVEISQTQAKITIDQSEAFADANLTHSLRYSRELAQRSFQQSLQYIAKAASEGEELMRVEHGGNVIPQIAKRDSQLFPERDVTIGLMAKPLRVDINVQPGETTINVNRLEPDIHVTKREPQIQHQRWQTDIYLQQKQSIAIQATGHQVNKQV